MICICLRNISVLDHCAAAVASLLSATVVSACSAFIILVVHTHTYTHVLSVWRRHVHVESLVAHPTPGLAGARAGAGAGAEAAQEQRWVALARREL